MTGSTSASSWASRLRMAVGRARRVPAERWDFWRTPVLVAPTGALAPGAQFSLAAADIPASEWIEVEKLMGEVSITAHAVGVNPGDRRALYYVVKCLRPRTVLEIGTHVGASSTHIALALKRLDDGDGQQSRRLVTVDLEDVNDPVTRPWAQHGAINSPAEAVRSLGLDAYVHFVHSSATGFMQSDQDRYDLIFLDGDHSAAAVYRELCAALTLLNDGGRILLHDFFPREKPLWSNGVVIPGPWRAVERLRREGAAIDVWPLGALPWPTKLRSHVTSLASVGALIHPRGGSSLEGASLATRSSAD
jgi:predicted O-methyltransferase YrrM